MAVSTRQRLIKTAANSFYRDGFHGVGLDRLLTEAGVTKTTFYNHFESKEQLILVVLQEHDRWWRNEFAERLRHSGGTDPAGQLMAVFDVLDGMIAGPDFNGCIFVNVAAEFPIPHDPVHKAAADHKLAMELILRDLALRAGATDPAALAEELAIIMEGTYVTHQVTRNANTSRIARRLGELLFGRYLPVRA